MSALKKQNFYESNVKNSNIFNSRRESISEVETKMNSPLIPSVEFLNESENSPVNPGKSPEISTVQNNKLLNTMGKKRIINSQDYVKSPNQSFYDEEILNNDETLSLQEQLNKQSEIIEKMHILLMEKKESEKRKNEISSIIDNNQYFKPPNLSEVEKPIEKKVEEKKVYVNKSPKYSTMNEVEIRKYKEKFRKLFNELKNLYPTWTIRIPDIDSIPLQETHDIYEETVKTIIIYQTAGKFKVGLVIIFAGIEYFCYYKMKIKAFKNFTHTQIKGIHKWNNHLLNFSKLINDGDGDGGEWPEWMKFIFDLVKSIGTFAVIQGGAGTMGYNAPDFVLKEADKFISPAYGIASINSDGISEIPEPLTGNQNPDNIINQGVKFMDSINAINAMNENVKAKPVKTSKFEDIFDGE